MNHENNSQVMERLLKSRKFHARIRVTADATAADKTHNPEYPDFIKLKTEGIDDITGSDSAASTDIGAQTDANGNVAVLLLAENGLGTIDKVISASVSQKDGGTWTATLVDTGTTVDGLSAAGNIALELDSDQSLATTNADCYLSVEYIKR